jgi:hypothetical protein
MISRISILPLALLALLVITPSALADYTNASGRWRGNWSSAESGHRGPLRAVIRETPAGGYRALFVGRFAGVVPFAYRADLHPVAASPGHYASVKRLPLLGEYHMQATISGGYFRAEFAGGRDVGVFQMVRRK